MLDVRDRQLWRGNIRLDLSARYFDVLKVLVEESGTLVEKDRLFETVWGEVIVSDSALTQCIKEIRKHLDDDASNPRYIQTVPRHGYRFVGEVTLVSQGPVSPQMASSPAAASITQALYEWGAGTLGGALAGLFGGLLYGFGLASGGAGSGSLSTLLVLVALNVVVGLTGGFGVGVGFAAGGLAGSMLRAGRVVPRILGAAIGGLLIGSLAKLLGVDAFNLLVGRAPAGITGGKEGAVLGAALATGAIVGHVLALRREPTGRSRWYPAFGAGLAGAGAGALIPLAGGRLMGGSLDLLAKSFDDSGLQLDSLALLFGEAQFGQATQVALGGIEGLLFGLCVFSAIVFVHTNKSFKSPYERAHV